MESLEPVLMGPLVGRKEQHPLKLCGISIYAIWFALVGRKEQHPLKLVNYYDGIFKHTFGWKEGTASTKTFSLCPLPFSFFFGWKEGTASTKTHLEGFLIDYLHFDWKEGTASTKT